MGIAMKNIWTIILTLLCFNPFLICQLNATENYLDSYANTQDESDFDMVIITTNLFINDIQPLVDHKNSIQKRTYIKTIEEIYTEYAGRDNAEKIKYFIKDAHEQFNISYVLLIGSFSIIPGRYTHIYFDQPFDYPTPDEWIFPSDFYFADLYNPDGNFCSWDSNNNNVFAEYHWNGNSDEIDLTPDIFLGRLACENQEQVTTCIDKIIRYESNRYWSEEWFTNLVLIAGDGIPFDPENVDESEYLQEKIIEIMQGFVPVCIWASNGKLLDAMNINKAIEQGAGFVFFNGHGLHNLWATYLHNTNHLVPPGAYRTEHINMLSNYDKLPIVISDACYHLQYDAYPDCFGWSFVSNPNGGAIAFIGGSDTDLAYGGTRIVEKGIEKLCLKMSTLYQENPSTLGKLWKDAITLYNPGDDDIVDIITITQNHLFGDPSLLITDESLTPLIPDSPTGPSTGKPFTSYEFTIKTTDPENDDIYYLFDWDDNSSSSWIGPFSSGEECTASHTWTYKNTFQIRVKAKDSNGMQSQWSDPLVLSLPKNNTLFYEIFYFIFEKVHNLMVDNK